MRALNALDRLIGGVDDALRAVTGNAAGSGRHYPAADLPETHLDDADRRQAAGLMRVNHAGEVAAQALYQAQALTARSPAVREHLRRAARARRDHLLWCAERLRELDSRTSLLDPFWYAGSFTIGALAGLAGDRVSLGFVAETERQVEAHLDDHLRRLPVADERSRAVVTQMQSDEERHGADARAAGGIDLPQPVPTLMRAVARIMTGGAYWI
ncbi:MAG: 2-polyprenyl-3-methyl-6-methoxy-1,4-benzoquinone monooxygenase [Planctomycetes bacterium]|nr:2-polyprenyl-3-methyl-6-methoxy-1,4-benzoquinone monooxygenase [Planctomycetota bacterium]